MALELLPKHVAKLSELARYEPVKFIRDVLGTILYAKSREIINAVWEHDQVAVSSCHASGKSYLSARIAATYLAAYPGQCKVITTAPTQRQVESIFWGEYHSAINSSKFPFGGKLNLTDHKLGDGWFCHGFTARQNDSVAFQGYHAPHILIIIDEASGVPPNVWSAINTLKSGGHVKVLAIGNPTSTDGDFFDCFKRFAPSWYKIHISAFDTPNIQARNDNLVPGLITYKYVKQMYTEYGPDSPLYQVRVLGEFPHETDFTLIQVLWVDRAVNDAPAFDYNDDIIAGFDAARSGLDECALAVRCGTRLLRPISAWMGMDEMQSVGNIRRILDPLRKRLKEIRIDTVGIGGGIHDRLKELGYPVLAINGSESPRTDPQQFKNLRAEMWWSLRDKFKNNQVGGPMDELTQHQLTSIQYQYTSDNKLQIEDKPTYKKRMKMSPDRAEAILYCFADFSEAKLSAISLPGFGDYGITGDLAHTGVSMPQDYTPGYTQKQMTRANRQRASRAATMAQRRRNPFASRGSGGY